MHYVKLFNINGVDTKQVACIELQGKPNAATEGAVGVLGMDMTSPTHEIYRCVAVKGSIYTWEALSAGMSILSAKVTGEGVETFAFPYDEVLIPDNYLVKVGDLIIDSLGYLYKIDEIAHESFLSTYSGTHISGSGGNGISEWDYVIDKLEDFTSANLAKLSGRVLVKGVNYPRSNVERLEVSVPNSIEIIKFVQSKLYVVLTGTSSTKVIGLIGASDDYPYDVTEINGFGGAEFCTGELRFNNCKNIRHCSANRVYKCVNINDIRIFCDHTEDARPSFEDCDLITNVHFSPYWGGDEFVEFVNCSNISNVFNNNTQVTIKYENCHDVNGDTCDGYYTEEDNGKVQAVDTSGKKSLISVYKTEEVDSFINDINFDLGGRMSYTEEQVEYLNNQMGDIDTVLDNIIAKQKAVIGGDA